MSASPQTHLAYHAKARLPVALLRAPNLLHRSPPSMSSCEQGPQQYALLAALAPLQLSLALLQSCNLMRGPAPACTCLCAEVLRSVHGPACTPAHGAYHDEDAAPLGNTHAPEVDHVAVPQPAQHGSLQAGTQGRGVVPAVMHT